MSLSKTQEKEQHLKSSNNGLIIINKPQNLTSRDVVNEISHIFKTKKVGHNGTLDPLATGVLVICLNRYTKLNKFISAEEKEYIAEVTLGIQTDSLDITGKIINQKIENLNKKDLLKTLKKFETTYMQEVPLYSAVKVNGKKLYNYARKGEKVTLPKKEVTIKNIKLLDFKENKFTFKLTVSKGTYVRSLIRDILNDLNILGTMSNLTRTKQGTFDINASYTLDDIKQGNYKLLKIKDVLNIPVIKVNEEEKNKIINGAKIIGNYPDTVLFIDQNNEELAIYQKQENNIYKISVLL